MENRKFTASVILTLLSYIVRGAYPSNGLEVEYNNDGHTHRDELCLGSYEVRDKRIIRTEDSLNNNSLFVDAIVSDSYEHCLSECCKRDIKVCDTTVFIENDAETEENCFLFRCWFGSDDQRCLFSYHEGYRSSVIGGFEAPRFSDLNDLPVQNTNVEEEDEIVNIKFKTTTPPSPTTKAPAEKHVPKKTTTSTASVQQDFVVEHQQCITTQYKCPDSGECIPKRLVCDRYEDCQDKSDEKDCSGYPASVEDQQFLSPPEVIPPDTKSLATTAPPPPQPTPDDQDPGGSITNKVTLATEQPPLAPSYPQVISQAEEHIQEVVITEELEGASGAMFPLVVGLLLTFFLLVMVGFRLQYMNRRVRYGRMKTNAHDADYLINGMYL